MQTVLSIDVGIHRVGFVLGALSSAWDNVSKQADVVCLSSQARVRLLLERFVVPVHVENINLVEENGYKLSKAKQIGPMNTILGCYRSFMKRIQGWPTTPSAIVVEIQDATNAFMRQTSTAMMGVLVGYFHALATPLNPPPKFFMVRGSHKMEICRQVFCLHTPLEKYVLGHGGALPENMRTKICVDKTWTVARLKQELKAHRLPMSGTRNTLIDRLEQFHAQQIQKAQRTFEEHEQRESRRQELLLLSRKELESQLKEKGLPRTGKKADLIDRILFTKIEDHEEGTQSTDMGHDRFNELEEDEGVMEAAKPRKRSRGSFGGPFRGRYFAAQKKKRRSAYESRKNTSVAAVRHWQQCRCLEEELKSMAESFDQTFESFSEHDKRDVADAWWQCVHVLSLGC